MSEQNRPLHTDESASSGQANAIKTDAVQAGLHEAANAASGNGEGDFSNQTVKAATEEIPRSLNQAVAAAGSLATQGDGAEGAMPWIDPAPGTKSPATTEGGITTIRCRGFMGEGEKDEKKGSLGDGPCIVTTGEESPATVSGTAEKGHVVRDPGIHPPDEEEDRHPDGGCIRVVGDGGPVETQADVSQGADGTVVALNALIRTLA